MKPTWDAGEPTSERRIGLAGWVRVILRGVPLVILIFGGLAVLLAVRLIERPMYGRRRPWTPHITQRVCRAFFLVIGMNYGADGTPMPGPGAVVANHASWLDIFALNAAKRIYFVAKDEVAGWPAIGWLARATGTVFIRRDRRAAADQVALFRERLQVGHKLLFFPEGTSTDGLRVLRFKSTLFAAFFEPALRETLMVQAVTVNYAAPKGCDPRFYGWWGDMGFGPHMLATLAARRQGAVHVIYHQPVAVREHANRKSLARALEEQVRSGLAVETPG